MKLRQVRIEGYRSIREPLVLDVDQRITVILGANDHGKTNALAAIRHLNEDAPFDRERDLNWDYDQRSDEFPRVDFMLALTDDERGELLRDENEWIQRSEIKSFCERLEEAAAELESQATAAQEALTTARANVEQVRAASSDTENAAAVPAAEAEVSTLEAQAAASAESATAARGRVQLARAEERRVAASAQGQAAPDFPRLLEEAEAALARAETNHKRAMTRTETAESNFQTASATHPAGSEELTKAEKERDSAAESAARSATAADEARPRVAELKDIVQALALADSGDLAFEKGAEPPKPALLKTSDIPETVTVSRIGVEGQIEVTDGGSLDSEGLLDFVTKHVPRVELIRPQDGLSDTATAETINADGEDFMRGIFRYAGLQPEEWEGLFTQDNRSSMRLDRASEILNETLRKSWSQGSNLTFKLDHHEGGEIHLRIGDPAVQHSYVLASRRSSGFTHFFALKTVLYARQEASGASSFIWLFDEPGIYLHPQGQHDLLQVLETLAQSNQVLYSTHSIFLINKNFPIRHRLLRKDKRGTAIDHKPYAGQWRTAIDALGLSFPGTFLFASKVLLVEGDSDPILINADLQKLSELGLFEADINGLSIMATGNSKHTDALIRILLDSAIQPTIALLFDGDKGGGDRRKNLKALIESKKLLQHELAKGAIEDQLLSPELFREATILYAISLGSDEKSGDKIRQELQASWEENESLKAAEKRGLDKWSREETKRVLGLGESPSSVGIAREYARLLSEVKPDDLPKNPRKTLALAEQICTLLDLPSRFIETDAIFQSEDAAS